LVLGIIILAVSRLSLVTFAILFSIGLLVRGAVPVAAGVQLRRLGSARRSAARPSSTARPARP
jgi:hypothetical protein